MPAISADTIAEGDIHWIAAGVSHSQGHARSHQLQPGIITEPWAVSQSFHWGQRPLTRPHQPDDHHNLTYGNRTRQATPDGAYKPPKQLRPGDADRPRSPVKADGPVGVGWWVA
jgi:hypothetical protein